MMLNQSLVGVIVCALPPVYNPALLGGRHFSLGRKVFVLASKRTLVAAAAAGVSQCNDTTGRQSMIRPDMLDWVHFIQVPAEAESGGGIQTSRTSV